jgi:hypothetical protein
MSNPAFMQKMQELRWAALLLWCCCAAAVMARCQSGSLQFLLRLPAQALWAQPPCREDPELKPVFEEIRAGGMAAMMKYFNDPTFLQVGRRCCGAGGGWGKMGERAERVGCCGSGHHHYAFCTACPQAGQPNGASPSMSQIEDTQLWPGLLPAAENWGEDGRPGGGGSAGGCRGAAPAPRGEQHPGCRQV